MTDDVLAYDRPFLVILWGEYMELLYVVFYFLTEAIEGFCAGKKGYGNVFICASKVVGLLLVGIGVKVREDCGNIYRNPLMECLLTIRMHIPEL